MPHHLLRQVHQILEGAVRLVELKHRELRIVARRQPLVAEAAVDLIDALEAAHHQPLQVEFRRHAQVEVSPQRVVVRDEGPRRGAARNRVHHRRLDFEIAALVQERAQCRDDARAGAEHFAHAGVHDEVEIALPIADLQVREATVLLRQRPHGLGEQREALGLHGQLALVRAHQRAMHPHDVAQIPQLLERPVGRGAHAVLSDIALDAPAGILQSEEAGAPHHPAQHDAAGHGDRDGRTAEGSLVQRRALILQRRRQRRALEAVRIRAAALAQGVHLGAALGQQPAGLRHARTPLPRPAFRLASMKPSMSPSSTLLGSLRSTWVRKSFTRD